jgi:hypothetical protein
MRSLSLVIAVALLAASSGVRADIYLHNPRGSNNRLNEQSANRDNGNRLFDSQNNNRGGYNVCDKTYEAFDPHNPLGTNWDSAFDPWATRAQQYQMVYFERSEILVEWTAQHGCGGNENGDPTKQNCDMVIQYMCDTEDSAYSGDAALKVVLRDGGNTGTPDEPGAAANGWGDARTTNLQNQRGHHESEEYYLECRTRQRNVRLFTADQILNGDTARFTRQNPNGNRRGLECPEERDHHPYWHPSPWRDVAVLTDAPELLCDLFRKESMNTANKFKCVDPQGSFRANIIRANNWRACNESGGMWTAFKHNLPEPECRQAEYSRTNSLGNTRDGQPATYKWTLPSVEELRASGVRIFDTPNLGRAARCVMRLRYNISTDDYDPMHTNSSHNKNVNNFVMSPVTQDPVVDIGIAQGLRLAINTNQFGRTFQDRTHVFYIRERPLRFLDKRVINLNVRGKRGNIVQTFPSVEYDFIPTRMSIEEGDLVHVQWCGSNTHNNGHPGGDGQTGDAGQGTGGTDRHNMVQIVNPGDNFPMALDREPMLASAKLTSKTLFGLAPASHKSLWSNVNCYAIDGMELHSQVQGQEKLLPCQLALASSGHYRSLNDVVSGSREDLDPLLNNAPASFVGGAVLEFKPNSRGEYHYMCTRNNNFSNRSQKGEIKVQPPSNRRH